MTRVADRKTVMEAETSARYRGKPLMVTVGPHDVTIREYKRPRRLAVAVPWSRARIAGERAGRGAARSVCIFRRQPKTSAPLHDRPFCPGSSKRIKPEWRHHGY